MATRVCLQVPNSKPGLLDELLLCSSEAIGGGAVFAWANAAGIIRFLESAEFGSLLDRGRFSLVVGLDSITDPPAIGRLVALAGSNSNLTIEAVLNETTPLFHPKIAWFDSDEFTTLVVGSGNLTKGGLRGNWEAHVAAEISGEARDQLAADLASWRLSYSPHLRPIDDPDVLARALKNVGLERTIRRNRSRQTEERAAVPVDETVLLAEAPKQTGRQGQMNVPLRYYQAFFGFRVGTTTSLPFQRIDDDGIPMPIETRRSVQVASHNYRFELSGLHGIKYDEAARPIGAFVHAASGLVPYMLLDSGSRHYDCVSALLDERNESRTRELRRAMVLATELSAHCPGVPLISAD
jgi:hypothetical protein